MKVYKFIIFIAMTTLIFASCDSEYNTINEDGNEDNTKIDLSSRSDKIHPLAQIEGLNDDANLGDMVFADGVSSSDSDGWIKEYKWSIDDIQVATASKHVFEFNSIGEQNICLEVTDNSGLKNIVCKSVTVIGLTDSNETKQPPIALFDISTNEIELHPNIPYTLNCAKSHDADENNQSITQCDWSQSAAYWYLGFDKIENPPNCAKLTKINETQTTLEICDEAAKVEIVLVVTDNEGDSNSTNKIYYIRDGY